MAQLIRDFAETVFFLVANRAYSAGTLLCLSGNEIRMGHGAALSPIDVTMIARSESHQSEEVELASIDSYIEFARRTREQIEKMLARLGGGSSTDVECALMVKMVEQVGALQIGEFFRARNLTGQYAEELLDSYMFSGLLDRESRRNDVIGNFLLRAPIHEFHLDYHLCRRWNLPVEEMATTESDLAKTAVSILDDEANSRHICPHLSKHARLPFIRLYPQQTAPQSSTGGTP